MSKSFRALQEVLTKFSGLTIKCDKNFAVFSKRVNDREEFASILGFQVKELPIRYLGTPLTGKLVRHIRIEIDCDGVLAELSGILTRWSTKKLSYMDKGSVV